MAQRLIDRLRQQVLLCDGGTGTLIQARNWDLERDFLGLENCSEVLVLTRPDFIDDLHSTYFQAGADCVETNTFGANRIVLSEFGLAERSQEINRLAASLAKKVALRFSTPEQPRYVLGSMGPGTKLPSLGHIDYDTLEASYTEQAIGLIEGGIDAFLLETHQDLLTLKAGINGCRIAKQQTGREDVGILAQVTMESTGTMLVGSDMMAALVTLSALGVDGIGLNCATGPAEMAEHVKTLGENWPGLISVMPNAGLPLLVDGHTEYPLGPQELAYWQKRFVEEDGVHLIGGCCGTTPAHISALRAMLDSRPNRSPKSRAFSQIPAVASLYSAVPLRQENAIFTIGERSNANGSKKFRELLNAEDWDALTAIGREQVKEGSHAIDLCVAYVGRPEIQDMDQVVNRYQTQVTAPLVIDSTEIVVIERALKRIGGKPILNSINFEDGEEKATRLLQLARKFGAAVVALTIDEQGMAKGADQKLEIARRLYDFAVHKHGLPPGDLLFDPLTFTICTGVEEDRGHAIQTLEAISAIRSEMPECQIMLGLSNVSFGLKAEARAVLNSVFLHHAVAKGMTAAILHVSKIQPLHRIDPLLREAAEDLIFNRRKEGQDPLLRFIGLFKDITRQETLAARPTSVEEILKQRIVDGDRKGLEQDLARALQSYAPLEIINTLLLDGMRVVGELFGSGQMQLPFVLQSAETMKAAVTYLEPLMEKAAGVAKGTLVLATVKGDVHDIGKNLVDIILTNNGYKVINLGIKQPLHAILDAYSVHRADAIGMSGLLVKSTVIMRENLEEMARLGIRAPVLLGGAALTRRYVEQDCCAAYLGKESVHYAKDAFAGLRLMEQVMSAKATGA